MSDNSSRVPERSGKTNDLMAWLREFFSQFQLAWRLFWDDRVPFSTKLIPLLTLFYLLMPVDLVPDGFLGVGQVDDLVVVLVGLRIFISLCPLALVDEYRQVFVSGRGTDDLIPEDAEIIDLDTEESEADPSLTG